MATTAFSAPSGTAVDSTARGGDSTRGGHIEAVERPQRSEHVHGEGVHRAVEATLRDRITRAVHLGRLRPGSRLPSARRTALELGVDRRCVVAALRVLEREGLVELRARSGLFVHGTLAGAPTAAGVGADPLEGPLLDLVARALESGVGMDAVLVALTERLAGKRLRAACLADNADQGAALCAEARRMFGLRASWIDTDDLTEERPLTAAARAAQCVLATSYNTDAAHQLGLRLGVPVTIVTPRADRVASLLTALGRAPVYFIGTDQRFARSITRQLADFPGDHIRPVILGRGAMPSVPQDASVYVMATAEARLGGIPPQWRAVPRTCAFSDSSVRQVLATIFRGGAGR